MMQSLPSSGFGRFRLSSAPKRGGPPDSSRQKQLRRRPHAKSRSGCRLCKTTRVKCDEARPRCGRCSGRRTLCVYDPEVEVVQCESESPAVSRSLVEGGYHGYHGFRKGDGYSRELMTPSAHIAQNFLHCVDVSFASVVGKVILSRFILPGCAETPMLMHGLLALSARHLRYLQPECRAHEVAFRFHTQVASGLLNTELAAGVGVHNIDLVYATCLMINMVSFMSDDGSVFDSWIFKEDETSIEETFVWYMIQEGMGFLSVILKRHMEQSLWRLKSESADVSSHTMFSAAVNGDFSGPEPILPRVLVDICEITSESTMDNNPYYFPLRLLSRLYWLKRENALTLDSILAFGPRVSHAYRVLVRGKDERALLLFMLWLRLLYRENYWWVAMRARNEYAAVSWLLGRSNDARVRMIALDPDIFLRCVNEETGGTGAVP